MSLAQRVLAPIVQMRTEERTTAFLMFAYSFLAMAGYNVVKPATRSQFINSLGADNLPYVQLVAGLIMGFVIQGYTNAMRLLPRRWVFAATQIVMVALLGIFWMLFQTGQQWVSVLFYLWGVLAGSLLISQFWSLANDIYEARQAKRLFGFIGGGAGLGGIVGAGFAGQYAQRLGTNNLLLVAAVFLLACFAVVWAISVREKPGQHRDVGGDDEKGMSPLEAIRLLRESKHFQVIALVISFAAIGAGIVEQQMNMAMAEEIPGKDARTAFLANVIFYSSIAGFLIQMTLTSRLHRLLGIGFALLLLPVTLGGTAVLMLLIPRLWASTTARVLDTSLRYSVDKTTREILFMPLPASMKYKAKPFADVAVDRFAKGVGAVALIVAIKVFHLTWWQLSYLSLAAAAMWMFLAFRARREYLSSFRKSLESREMDTTDLRVGVADLSTVETLLQELAHPEPARVIYAIDVLESLDKRNLVTPLLLYHEAPAVRERTLRALGAGAAERWAPQIRRALSDADAGVRTAALRALASLGHEDAVAHARPLLSDSDSRIRTTAALALTASMKEADIDVAYDTLVDVISDTSPSSRAARSDVAGALGDIPDERFKGLLIPLLYDHDPDVADAAMHSVRKAGSADFIFVPALISLLRNRQVKAGARQTLVGYGEAVIEPLAHFMGDTHEDLWLRRHIPTTLASIVSQRSVDVLVSALQEPDGFLRYKIIAALERLRRADDALVFDRTVIEPIVIREARAFLTSLSLHHNLFVRGKLPTDTLLPRGLEQKMGRSRDRIYRLLSLIYPWKDVDAAQWTLAHGDSRARSSASEYLDNLLSGQVRHLVLPVLEDMPLDEKVRRANVLQRTRSRDIEETLLELINDDDQVIAAVAIDVVRQQRLWTLATDVEHVLAHRDVRDWYVFEAASWALAEQRMPAERRRELWLEPLPAAVLADRLRGLPLFASVSVDELFRIASASKQVRHDPGTVLMTEGATPDTIHLLLDGDVVASGGRTGPETLPAPAALGFAEALEGAPVKRSLRTAGVAVTLALTTDELRSLLADNTELVRGLFAEMSHRAESPGAVALLSTGAAVDLEQLAADGVAPIEKVLALQRVPYFAQMSAEETQQLAGIARQVAMTAGTPLFAASSPPATWLVLAGEVQLEQPGGAPLTARGGDTIGSFCALSGNEVGLNATVTRSGVALRIGRDDLFELMAERPDLLRQMFAGISRLSGSGAAAA